MAGIKIEKRPSRGNLRLSRKQKTERVRRERINSSVKELKSLVCKDEEKQDKLDKADILEATVNFVRNTRVIEYQQNPKFRAGYNQCVSEFVQFLVSLENVKPDDKAKLLAGMSNVLCGVKKADNTVDINNVTPLPPQNTIALSAPNGKVAIPRLQRQPLQTINTNVLTSSEQHSSLTSECSSTISSRGSIPSPASDSSTSSLSSVVSWLGDDMLQVQREEVEPSFGNILDSVFCDSGDFTRESHLETSLGKAIGAGMRLELTGLPTGQSESCPDEIEEMAGFLPPMCTFLEDLSN